MKRVLFLLAALLPLIATAETKEQRLESRHELRIGIGDPIIASAFNPTWDWGSDRGYDLWAKSWGKDVSEAHDILKNGRYHVQRGKRHVLGNIFLEYQYRINPYIGVGLKTNMVHYWKDWDVYNGYNEYKGKTTSGEFYMDFVPMARFTFLHKEYVNLYAAAGMGFAMMCNYNYPPDISDMAVKFEATLFGISSGKNGFFGAVEVFDLSLCTSSWFFLPTQFVTASIGYRF